MSKGIGKGWHYKYPEHALAAKGIRTKIKLPKGMNGGHIATKQERKKDPYLSKDSIVYENKFYFGQEPISKYAQDKWNKEHPKKNDEEEKKEHRDHESEESKTKEANEIFDRMRYVKSAVIADYFTLLDANDDIDKALKTTAKKYNLTEGQVQKILDD